MNCTKCPTAARIAAITGTTDADELDRLRRACLACDPDAISHHGASHVAADTVDATLGGSLAIDRAFVAARSTPTERATPLPADTEDALVVLLKHVTDLDFRDLGVLWALLRGLSAAEYARVAHLKSRQTASARMLSAIRAHPWLGALHRQRMRQEFGERG